MSSLVHRLRMRIDTFSTLSSLFIFILLTSTSCGSKNLLESNQFDSQEAYSFVDYQCSLGARVPNSLAHKEITKWLVENMEQWGWNVEIQVESVMNHDPENVVAKWGTGEQWILFGAHYDSRLYADNDPYPVNQLLPVPGANDGASGVAVLLEIGKIIPKIFDPEKATVWIVYFDLEDNGNIPGYDWILGSRAFVNNLHEYPDKVVIIDMIGDSDLNIYKELNSNPVLIEQIWNIAEEHGYSSYFIKQPKYRILDDHIPFIEKGIQAVDIIDFDYLYWHTVQDTPDKVSGDSLDVVGRTLLYWLREQIGYD